MKRPRAIILDANTLNLPDEEFQPILETDCDWLMLNKIHSDNVPVAINEFDIVITNKVILGEKQLSQSPVNYIGVLATGTNNIDMNYCEENNINVKNIVGYSTESVAQHTLALLLNLASSQSKYIHDTKRGLWEKSNMFCMLGHPIVELSGKTLGIIGYGHIGKRVEELAKAFGMKTLICESFQKGHANTGRTPLTKLLNQSDFISLHCPLTELTQGLVDQKFLSAMKDTAFLINTARGPIIIESDLEEALANKDIAGAALDVLVEEPANSESPIVRSKLSNLILTPHNAWASVEARKKLILMTADNLNKHLQSL